MSKTSIKHGRDKNSLEQFLLNGLQYFKTNREKVYQYILVLLLVVLAAMVIKYITNRDTAAFQNQMDDAYYLSTNRSFLEFAGTPDPTPYEELATKAKGDFEIVLKLAAGESYWRAASSDVQRKIANSKATVNDETVAALDPESGFTKAFDEFVAALNAPIKSADVKARALYDAAVAAESLASIAKDDATVAARLDDAKKYYQTLTDSLADSAYAKPARERLISLNRPVSLEYYKKTANNFVNLPIPEGKAEDSIVSDQLKDLDPNAAPAVDLEKEDFSLQNDSDESATPDAPEADVPATEAAATTDSADVIPAAGSDSPVQPASNEKP